MDRNSGQCRRLLRNIERNLIMVQSVWEFVLTRLTPLKLADQVFLGSAKRIYGKYHVLLLFSVFGGEYCNFIKK